ncbi:MAG: tripartite tricarboxylate transporter permease, partial [Sphaerochaetaceae bacterium]|nr:tripartite tricarboxylate transporter permease [Sphaerochaetaceae bacterium]
VRSAVTGVFIGAIPGIGEDIAAWVSYGLGKNSSKNAENYGKGEPEGILCTETANNACIGGALIPLMTLGIPGSPPAAMLLGALMLHGISPGPMIEVEHPGFFMQVGAILFLSIIMMYLNARVLSKIFINVLKIPVTIFMPMVAVLCVIGSYSLGLNNFNLYLMIIVGIVAYFLGKMEYPIPPLIIGVILGPMADENLRRALMVSRGNIVPFFTRPVSLILILMIILLLVSNLRIVKRFKEAVVKKIIGERNANN